MNYSKRLIFKYFSLLLSILSIPEIAGATVSGVDRIIEDYVNREITYEDYVEYLIRYGLDRESLDERYREGEPVRCLTSAIAEYLVNRGKFTSERRREIDSLILKGNAPLKSDGEIKLLDEEKSVCYHQYENYITTEHFVVEWSDDGEASSDDAESAGEYLEYAWEVEIEELGFEEPNNSDEFYILVYFDDLSWASAYTTLYEGCGEWLTLIVISTDTLVDSTYLMDVTAHEFFHVIQFGYFLRTGAMESSMWWWEASATWIEDEVWDNLNYYSYLLPYYTEYPYMDLRTVNYGHEYAMFILAKYLTEYQGGSHIILDIWEAKTNNVDMVEVTDRLLEEQGITFKDAFAEFTAVNTVMDYEEGAYYDEVDFSAVHRDYPTGTIFVDNDKPEYYGTNYIKFKSDSDNPGTLIISFDGEEKKSGREIEWQAVVTAERDNRSYEIYNMELDHESQSGEIKVKGFGDEFSTVFLSVTPDYRGRSGVQYSYSGTIVIEEEDEDSGGCGGCIYRGRVQVSFTPFIFLVMVILTAVILYKFSY